MATTDSRGYALPAAIGGLVIVGVLVTAGFYMARQEVRIGVASQNAALAVNVAQAGANQIMSQWNGYELGNIPVWGDTTLHGSMDAGDWEVTVRNMNSFVYFLDATGTVTQGGALWAGARRRIGVITKMTFAEISPPAALTTRGATTVKGGAAIYGSDVEPGVWDAYCDEPLGDKPGVISNDTSQVGTSGSGVIDGDPPEVEDSTIVDSTFTNFGEMNWDELVALAMAEGKNIGGMSSQSAIEPDSSGPGACRESTLTNWGDTLPGTACGNYFPLIYHPGPTLSIQGGGYGQGVLLVDGTLDLRGGFAFYGIIIVQGTFQTQGSGNRVMGGVLASNAQFADTDQSLVGGSIVQYSNCAAQRAILNNSSLSKARPLPMRSWVDLTSVTN